MKGPRRAKLRPSSEGEHRPEEGKLPLTTRLTLKENPFTVGEKKGKKLTAAGWLTHWRELSGEVRTFEEGQENAKKEGVQKLIQKVGGWIISFGANN